MSTESEILTINDRIREIRQAINILINEERSLLSERQAIQEDL